MIITPKLVSVIPGPQRLNAYVEPLSMSQRQTAKTKTPAAQRHFYKQAGKTKKQLFQPKKRTAKLLQPPAEVLSPAAVTPPSPPPPKDASPSVAAPAPAPTPSPPTDPAEAEKQALTRTIEDTVARLAHDNQLHVEQKQAADQPAAREVAPQEFDGLSGPNEQYELLSQEIRNYQRKTSKLTHELDVIKTDFDKEKKQLKRTIIDLRQELHRTAPLHDHKFFSLSEDVKQAINEIETSVDGPLDPDAINTMVASGIPAPSTTLPNSPAAPAPAFSSMAPLPTQATAQPSLAVTPKGKDKKLLITGVVLLFFLVSGAAVSYKVMSKPQVDQKLVDQYLESGQVQGAQNVDDSAPKVDRYAEIPFDQTNWQGFEDPFYGIRFQYPANVAEKQKNGNGIAILRKDSYLFKFQQIPSELGVKEYWDQTKNSEINYQVEEVKFKGKTALHLTTTDQVDYPGEKYLVKNNDSILDLWFPTPSDKFSDDDMQRVQRIMDTVSFF